MTVFLKLLIRLANTFKGGFMMIRVLLCLSFLISNAFALGPDGPSYYGDFNPATSPAGSLKETLFTILSSPHLARPGQPDRIGPCPAGMPCYSHSPVGYSRARTILFGELFLQQDNRGNYVEEVYCDDKVYFRDVTDISHMDNQVNIEHTWPQSKFSPSFSKDMQKSDLHHLFPADSKANGVRGNYPFGNPPKNDLYGELPGCSISQISDGHGQRVFTPPTSHRGNVARAIFYFSVRYRMPIDAQQEAALREWHHSDPIDAQEVWRHNKIAGHQLERNPFVDYPQLVDRITDF